MHLAGYGGPYAGSFVPMLRGVMRAARERGWSCEAVFGSVAQDRGWLDELRDDGIPFRIAQSTSRAAVSSLVRDLLAESREPTVLHTHFTTFDIAAAGAAARHEATKVFWHVHTPHHGGLPMRARNRFKYTVLGRRVERILCVSTDLVDVVAKRGAPLGRVEYLPNAVEVDRFPLASQAEREQARRELGLPPGPSVLVHFGWDWERKGGDVFCEAVARLRGSGREVVGLTVGSPDRAAQTARRLGLAADVLRVQEARDDVRGFYCAADVFVASSRAEGTPYSVLEAVSCGAAIVASEIPGHVEIGREVPGCRMIPLDDAAAAADAAAALLDRTAEQAGGDARAGHEWVRRNRDLAAWTEALMRRYEAAQAIHPARWV